MHTGVQEQMRVADVFSLSTASINVLLPSAIRETQSDQWFQKAFVQVCLSLHSHAEATPAIGISLNATLLERNRDWD